MKIPNPRFPRTPLPLWICISVTLLVTVTLVAYAATHVGFEEREQELESTLKEQSWRTLQVLSAGALEPVITEDIGHLDTLATESVRLDPDLHSINVFNDSGQELFSWARSEPRKNSDTYTYKVDIEFEGENFGRIVASWDPTRLLKKIAADLKRERNHLLLSLLVFAGLCLLLLRALVVAPLNKMRLQLESLSQGTNLEPLKINSSRELSMVAQAINELDDSIAKSRSLSIELEYQANHDGLTGLINRYAIEKHLVNHLENRRVDQAESTLLYIDLDQFKLVNDTCGHAAGDALLVQLALILKQQLNEDDLLARMGGDEFCILLIDTPLQQGLDVAERIRDAAQSFRFSWEEKTFAIETSIGVVPVNRQHDDFERLLTAADEACYQAKQQGRNRVICYVEEDQELRKRLDLGGWVPRILDAIEGEKLVLYGQPIEPTDSRQKQGLHLEILVRMLGDNNEVIPPGAFLPAAERYGLMPHIDRYVLTHTVDWMATHVAKGRAIPVCAVNLSGHSLCDPDFREFVVKCLKNNPQLCGYLSFEVTETAAVSNLAVATEFMHEVISFGCTFSLDDFGSGMSSFTYLKNLPVDYVKIDGAFVKDILSDPTSLTMVKAISDIASVMEIQSIAEFVESQEIRNELLELGIDFVQGYGVAKPAPLANYETDSVSSLRNEAAMGDLSEPLSSGGGYIPNASTLESSS